MNNKFFLLILAVFLIGNVFALTQIGEYKGSFDVDVGDAVIIIGKNVTCIEDWTCSYWSGCTGNTKTFECRDCNHCGTYSLLPQNCGATETCQQQNNGGGNNNDNGGSSSSSSSSGGSSYSLYGSSSSCTEKWECSEWNECKDGKQTRTCEDKNNCKTTSLKPSEERVCEAVLEINKNDLGTGGLNGITGAIIGALGPAGTIGVLIFIIAIIILAIFVAIMRKREK